MNTIYDVVIKPIITEKSNLEIANNRYTFKVASATNKIEIKKAVETIYKVKVARVNTANCRGKIVRWGRVEGKKKDWKKAIVTLQKGHKIEALVG